VSQHFDFREKFTDGERTARSLALHIQYQFPGTLIRPAGYADERRGIDLWLKRPDDGEVLSLQVKSDRRMGSTGNFFIETVSVVPDKPGWIWTTEAHTLCYVDESDWTVYWLQMKEFRAAFCTHWQGRREVSVPNHNYFTKGVPISKLEIIDKLHPLTTNLQDDPQDDPFSDELPDDCE
jgi:hypothetical protein